MKQLLPQPGGFEGFGSLAELVHADDLAVAEHVDLIEARIDLDPTALPTSPVVGRQKHAVPSVNHFLDSHLKLVPCLPPMLEVVSNRIEAVTTGLPRSVS